MEWEFFELGYVELVGPDSRGVLFQYKAALGRLRLPGTLFRLTPSGAEQTTEDRRVAYRQGPVPAPFERTALGKKSRLAWPNGATSIGEYAHLGGWGDRFAIVLDDRGLHVIDAESDRVARLMLPADTVAWEFADPIASNGHVWAAISGGIVAIPFASLEQMTAGALEVTWKRHHPLRNPDAELACVFLWALQDGRTMVEIGNGKGGPNEPKLKLEMAALDLEKYAPIKLVDELHPWHYAAVAVPGRAPVAVRDLSPLVHASKVTVTRAKDPTGVAKAPASALPARGASSDKLDRLLAEVVANPSDDAHRAVLADLLIELGDPSADAIAQLRASGKASPTRIKEALGPLGPYLTKVEFIGGLPVEATVTQNAPDEQDHAAELVAACADFRLSLIRTLHSQPGRRASPGIYARLAAAAVSLRRVDVSKEEVIDALIAANRDQLEDLEHVELGKASWMDKLATRTFDRVTSIHTVVGLAHLQPLVNRLLQDKSKFFKRAPRRLVLDETRHRHAELLQALAVVWPKLPLSALTVAGVTVARAGAITGLDPQLLAVARRAFAG